MKRFDVTIAGEINLDLILYGLAEQMPVERELLASDFRLTLGSSSAILAHNLAVMGLKVGFITMLGEDALGGLALDRLRSAGVDVSRVFVAQSPAQTGVTVLLHHGKTRHILTYMGTMAMMRVEDLEADYLGDSRHFHLSSLFLQTALWPGLPALCRRLKAEGLTLSLDTNDDPEDKWGAPLDELLDLVDILLPNEDEAMRMTGTSNRDEAMDRLAKRVPIVAMKCGADGSMVQADGERWMVAPLDVTPVDTIGAGDSFNAGFLRAWLGGKAVKECAREGNVCAALSITGTGGTEAFRDVGRVKEFLSAHGAL